METLLRIALSNTIGAAVLALLAFCVSRFVRRPGICHALWLLVLLKLLAPPIWTIPVHLLEGRSAPMVAPDAYVSGPLAGTAKRAAPDSNPHHWFSSENAIRAAFILWLSGSACYALIAVTRLRRFRTILRYAAPAGPDIQEQVAQLSRKMGLRYVPAAWLLPGPVCPMLWAAFARPRLLLPEELWQKLSSRQQSTLIAHELAHLKRRDHWVRMVELLATAVYWWNPILWGSRHGLREAEEQCCDAWVNAVLPEQKDQYAAALLEAVDFVSSFPREFRPMLPALASGIGQFRHLQRRLVMIQQGNYRTDLGRVGVVCVVLAMLVLPLSLGRAQRTLPLQAAAPEPDEQKPDPRATALFNRMLPELSFNAVGLTDVLEFLGDISGTKIEVDWKALEAAGVGRNTPITLHLQNVKFSKALDATLEAAGGGKAKLLYHYHDGVLTITTAEDHPRKEEDRYKTSLLVRVYDIRDLASDQSREESLSKMITGSIDSGSWRDNGGQAGHLRVNQGQLIVTQTPENHKAILNLLQRTRELMKERASH